MYLRARVVLTALVLSLAALPAAARADIVLSPFGGVHFGGDTPGKPATFGGSVTFVGRSLGLEIEAARTGDFFGDGATDVSLLTASLVGGADLPGTGIKPYFLAGTGLLRTNVGFASITDDLSYNNFAILLGGGLNVYVTDHVGLRGDLRYTRRLERPSDLGVIPIASNFDFWRATVGVNIRFF
jgi:opacity protein-like surface antigen